MSICYSFNSINCLLHVGDCLDTIGKAMNKTKNSSTLSQ